MKMNDLLRKKKLNVPLWLWIVFSGVIFVFYSIYTFHDIIWTTKNGLTIWYLIFDGKSIGEFYATPYPLDSNFAHAYYDFFIYVIFAVWDIPLFIFEKITGISFADCYFTLWYAKSISLFFCIMSAIQIYKLAYKVLDDKEKAGWSVFSFLFSAMVLQTIVIINGYDVISLFFTLCGIRAFLEQKDKKFVFYFSCAIACKMFAFWIFIPLILLRWKKVVHVCVAFISGISLILIPKMYFILYEKFSSTDTLIEGIDDTLSSVFYIDDYLWSGEAPIAISSIPLFFFFTFIIWVWCWFKKEKLSDKKILYISLVGMSTFFLTCETHPQWIILVMPYIAILECSNWNNLSLKLFLETCLGVSHILWKVRRSALCYSYNIVNNMLHLEEGDAEFWNVGVWTFINKIADVTHIQIDHIWTLIRSILVASFIMLLYYLRPDVDEEIQFPSEGRQYFYLKACCSMLVLGIPLLGIVVRVII